MTYHTDLKEKEILGVTVYLVKKGDVRKTFLFKKSAIRYILYS